MAATRSANPATARKPTAKATEIAQANTSKKRKTNVPGTRSAASSSEAKSKGTASKPANSKTAKPKAAPSGATSKKRKNAADNEESTAPSAKKPRITKNALPPKAKASGTKSTTKLKATKSTVAKAKTAKAQTAAPKATSRKRKTSEEQDIELEQGINNDNESSPPPAKKARTEQKAPQPKGRKPAAKPKVTKPNVVINTVPSQRLDVYVFGEGSSSELGLGTARNAIDVKRPRLNPLLSANEIGVVHLVCGGMHVAALTHDNQILTWGVNDQGALGRDTAWDGGLKDVDDDKSDESDQSDSGLNPLESIPTAVPASSFPEGTTFVQLSAGDSHTLALTHDGLVYGWGCFRVSNGFLSSGSSYNWLTLFRKPTKLWAYDQGQIRLRLRRHRSSFQNSRASLTSLAALIMPWPWLRMVPFISGVQGSKTNLVITSLTELALRARRRASSLNLFAPPLRSTKPSIAALTIPLPSIRMIESGHGVSTALARAVFVKVLAMIVRLCIRQRVLKISILEKTASYTWLVGSITLLRSPKMVRRSCGDV